MSEEESELGLGQDDTIAADFDAIWARCFAEFDQYHDDMLDLLSELEGHKK